MVFNPLQHLTLNDLQFRRESPCMDVEASDDLGRDNKGPLAELNNLDKG